jgi:hypothetical protein
MGQPGFYAAAFHTVPRVSALGSHVLSGKVHALYVRGLMPWRIRRSILFLQSILWKSRPLYSGSVLAIGPKVRG